MATDVLYCRRHPSVETGLRCGRCETPICPKCAVFTDVGARCPDCAPQRRMPQFELGALTVARAAAAGIGAGFAAGALWGLLLPGGFGFFTIFLGIGLGYAVAEPLSWASGRKVGPVMQTLAAVGVVIAYFARNATAGYPLIPVDDLSGMLALIAGVITAINRLRY